MVHQDLHRFLYVVQLAAAGVHLRSLHIGLQFLHFLDVLPSVYIHLESSGAYDSRKDTTDKPHVFKCIHSSFLLYFRVSPNRHVRPP